jgi:hypothetical protein
MLLTFDSQLQTLVVRDVIFIVTADHHINAVDVASEHLVEMCTLTMGLSATSYCRSKVALSK